MEERHSTRERTLSWPASDPDPDSEPDSADVPVAHRALAGRREGVAIATVPMYRDGEPRPARCCWSDAA